VVIAALLDLWDEILPAQAALGRRVLAHWEAPGRVYHGPAHLQACLTAWATLGGRARSEALALWFHDLIHHHQPGIDERASAAAAVHELHLVGLAEAEIVEIARLILTTIDHQPPAADGAAGRVCDADLAVLGAEPDRYRESVAALRAEFPDLDDDQWRTLRRDQVGSLRSRAALFTTPEAVRRWEAAAQRNLRQEWAALNDQASNGEASPAP
jgi:predicted metal-dependent HD superfamily phosphohydrolase